MRLNGHLVWILIPVGLNLLHGCTGPPDQLAVKVDFTVLEAKVLPGSCFAFLNQETDECHLLNVSFVNLDPGNRSEYEHWTALDASGEPWSWPLIDNTSATEPGNARLLMIGFTTPLGTNLTTLRWSHAYDASAIIDRPIPRR